MLFLLVLWSFSEIVSLWWIFSWRLTIYSLRNTLAYTGTLTLWFVRLLEFWAKVLILPFMFLSCSFFMEAITTRCAQKLFAIQTLYCAFLLLALFTNSYSLVSHFFLSFFSWRRTQVRSMLVIVTLWAQKNLTIIAVAIYFVIIAEFTC